MGARVGCGGKGLGLGALLGVLLFWGTLLPAQAQSSLSVGSYPCPPFVIEQDDGEYRGLSLLLWQQIAEQLALPYEMAYYELDALLEKVATGELDAGVSCISITPEREARLDFSHSFYETHLAIAVKPRSIGAMIGNLLTNKTLWAVLGVVALIAACVGLVYYLLERKVNDKLYTQNSAAGRGVEGFILGLLFITKGPFNYYEFHTLTGRVLTVLLAILTTFFLASVTAALASSLTLGAITSDINGPQDLRGKRVGAKTESTASVYLTDKGIRHREFEDLAALLEALDAGVVQAVVADDAVLKYALGQASAEGRFESISVLPYQFERQNYGLVLPDDSPIREELNQALLKVRTSPEWQQALKSYLGQ
ncbi:transporter substrate-binding domain-containing protein [Ferrimonas balearica]|uniref:transporter substrate-binding domain-containing protein n=1 Tax=Ferrimonas balearica TaxID=44012 RepID=UPI001C99F5F4|nr:transporter substrate-binding domain-containing protein [Ferrimonas balearica]MBY5993677.1 transporter substrate-binding domain-containing protein [Ferrimonas balearica]